MAAPLRTRAARMFLQHEASVRLGHVGMLYRPPSESDAFVLQATIGCSWNHCSYCVMYRGKEFRVRELPEVLEDVRTAGSEFGSDFEKVFVADGDALAMPTSNWLPVLNELSANFPKLRHVSCYATARNVLAKSPSELEALRAAGLRMVYMGPESGDDATLKSIVKGSTAEEHVEAAQRIKAAGIRNSAIFLLGIGGVGESSMRHAEESARLASLMDPDYLSALTVEVIPGTPLEKKVARRRVEIPGPDGILRELRRFVELAAPTKAVFRTNHASNYLSLSGYLPQDRERLLSRLDGALNGAVPLRPEEMRGL
eukprot:NODE_2173_length_1272_cov_30.222404_g1976_i0.p1 GENE.NODE_2173_length_1272_cov_30.222404_g1976_i0~~NODE_2173_length_1272_cov_30.222404_g1976_i0.p1  ORF type:complete len:313 (-),score=48.20 NODE_2173_length_1272_cov_30.222404_g1976_i0:215-1153(-)